jgi:polyhydroxyalkanoate synthesis regulator phasin
VETAVGNLPALGRDLHTLVQRIEQLEQKLAELENKKKG